MRRFLCLLLSLTLVFLVACGTNNGGGTTTNGQNGGMSDSGNNGGSSMNGMSGDSMGNGADNGGMSGIGMDGNGTGLPFVDGASVMINDQVYMLTGEVLRTDELGTQILATSGEIMSGLPSVNGEGYGIGKNTKVYQIKNNETNDAVAVEIEGVYYRATLHDTENSGSSMARSGMGNGASKGTSGASGNDNSSMPFGIGMN